MTELTELLKIGSGWTLVAALLIWGLLPGLILDVILRAYQRDDPRRRELQAELYVVPRWERPFWVFQQLEVVLREEGYPFVSWWFSRLVWHRAHLESGVERNRQYPESFQIPLAEEKDELVVGDVAKLMWRVRGLPGERMWVEVTSREGDRFTGRLINDPVFVYASHGEEIRFGGDHIIDYRPRDETFSDEDPDHSDEAAAA